MSAAVRDRTDVYELGAGSGLVTTYEAACDACRWRGEAHEGGGGGSTAPWNTNKQARALAQRSADRHNTERHVTPAD